MCIRDSRKGTYYFAQALDDTTYYIQFNQCMEDPKQPMDGFAAQVEAELEAGDYRQVLLDPVSYTHLSAPAPPSCCPSASLPRCATC